MNKSLALKIVTLCFICSFLTGLAVYAYTPTGTLVLSGGPYPGGPSYTAYNVGSTCYVKDGNGQVVYSGADPGDVITDALANGGQMYISEGTYDLDTPIKIVLDGTYVSGAGWNTLLTSSNDINIIEVDINDNIEGIYVGNLWIEGNDLGTSKAGIYFESCWYSTIENVHVEDMYYGISLYGPSSALSGGHVQVIHVVCESCVYAGVFHRRTYSSVYRHVSCYDNTFGYVFLEHAQGLEMFQCFGSQNINTGAYIVGVETGYMVGCQFSSNDYGIRFRDGSQEWNLDNVYIEASTYQNLVIESGTNTGSKYDTKNFVISNSWFVKAEREGIKIQALNGYETYNVRIHHCIIQNNGNLTDDTYYGIYCGDDGTGSVYDVWIDGCDVGNSDEWVGTNEYSRGIGSGSNTDYVHVLNTDTSTAETGTAFGINLVGANNQVHLSYNGTSWQT